MISIHLVALVLAGFGAAPAQHGENWRPSAQTVQAAAARRGARLARQTCASCHAVGRRGASPTAAPPFRDIVRRHSLSELEGRFVDGAVADHPPMPAYVFRASEIDDLMAYLETLQAPSRRP